MACCCGVVLETDATFPDGGAGGSFFMLKPDLFQGHQVFRQLAAPLEYRSISSLVWKPR